MEASLVTDTLSNIVNCIFQSLTSNVGGAILINSSYNVNLAFTQFKQCSATSSQKSSSGRSESSGGCCYFDVTNINISNIYTTECKSSNYSHAIFTTIPIQTKSYINCLSDFISGRSASPYSTVYGFDKGSYIFKDINITYPKEIIYPGSMHTGLGPEYSSYRFLNIKYKQNEESIAISFSLTNNGTNEVEYANFEKCCPLELGILGLLAGNHAIQNCNFIDCSGNLIYKRSSTDAILISYCYLSEEVTINSITITSQLDEQIIFPKTSECKFEIHQKIASCDHNSNIKINCFVLVFLVYTYLS